MYPCQPEELSSLAEYKKDEISDILFEANQNSRLDSDEHFGTLMMGTRDTYWNTDPESEYSLQDYLDVL